MMFFLKKKSDRDKLDKSLKKSKENLVKRLSRVIVGKSKIDNDFLDNLEEALISSDVGVKTTLSIIENIEKRVSKDKYINSKELNELLREEIINLLDKQEINNISNSSSKPYVIMVVGVNGAGKTTTIGKLAYRYKTQGKKILLGAADTFRAAAVDQLQVWADRVGCSIVKQPMGSDPASVAFDTVSSAKSQNTDVVIIDTAGRLHNKVNLMNELSKIKNVMGKAVPNAPHEIILVLDGSTGQNAFQQAKQFSEATKITSLAITKLDGTAKGGVIIGISNELKVPVKYIGVGEKIDDLEDFEKRKFIESFFSF